MLVQEQVFSILEILEDILLRLDMRTLLVSAQRTCRAWRHLITTSPPLQRALFFRPSLNNLEPKICNPLLAEKFPSFFRQETLRRGRGIARPVPLFTLSTLEIVRDPSTRELYLRKDASWRRMLVQQPPLSKIMRITDQSVGRNAGGLYNLHEFVCKDIEDYETNYNNRGIRMNLFYDLIISEPPLDSWFVSYMQVLWWEQKPCFRTRKMKTKWDVLRRAGAEADVLLYYSPGCWPRYDPMRYLISIPKEELEEYFRQNGKFPPAPPDPRVQEKETRISISFPYKDWESDKMGYGPRYLGDREVEAGRYPSHDIDPEVDEEDDYTYWAVRQQLSMISRQLPPASNDTQDAEEI